MWKSPNLGNSVTPGEVPRERVILDNLVDRLTKILPEAWSVRLDQEPNDRVSPRHGDNAPDAVLVLRAPEGEEAMVLIEAKRRLDPKLVPVVVDQLQRGARHRDYEARMVAAAYLSPRTRTALTEAGLGYVDTTGNLRLALDRPSLFIVTEGASADPWPRSDDRPLRSLKGPTASRVVRALCDFRPPYGVGELARRSNTSLASVSRVIAFLDLEDLITREPRGPVVDVKWDNIIRRWTEDYSFQRANSTHSYLEPRGIPALLGKLAEASWRYSLTGSLVAARVAPVAAPRLATLYVERADVAGKALCLHPGGAAANVIIAEPFDPVVFDRTWTRDGNTFAALSQVAADLLTGPGRSPAEGEELLRWMRENEDVWRA